MSCPSCASNARVENLERRVAALEDGRVAPAMHAATGVGETTIIDLVNAAAALWGCSPNSILGKLRHRNVSQARQAVMYVASLQNDLSLSTIGRLLGGRDHTTVIYGRDHALELIQENQEFRRRVDRLVDLIAPPETGEIAETVAPAESRS